MSGKWDDGWRADDAWFLVERMVTLVATRECTPPCLFAFSAEALCKCRCEERWHGWAPRFIERTEGDMRASKWARDMKQLMERTSWSAAELLAADFDGGRR